MLARFWIFIRWPYCRQDMWYMQKNKGNLSALERSPCQCDKNSVSLQFLFPKPLAVSEESQVVLYREMVIMGCCRNDSDFVPVLSILLFCLQSSSIIVLLTCLSLMCFYVVLNEVNPFLMTAKIHSFSFCLRVHFGAGIEFL